VLITKVKLKNFRCFQDQVFDFNSKIVLIEGENGSGKTSILEALYFICYLRSFRSCLSRDLINFEKDHFFISVEFEDMEFNSSNQLQVGFKGGKKVVKLNQQNVNSYKDIIESYKIISITEDDLQFVKGYPEVRRLFIDQALIFESSDFVSSLKIFKQILEKRNLFLQNFRFSKLSDNMDLFKIWTKQLWEISKVILDARINYLELLEKEVNSLLTKYFGESFFVEFEYKQKFELKNDFDSFWDLFIQIKLDEEMRVIRTCFGTHLDDFLIAFKGHGVKVFASRGQQKLVTFLIKVAQSLMLASKEQKVVFLLDDFLTDLDRNILDKCFMMLNNLNFQVFLTCPLKSFANLTAILKENQSFKVQVINV